MRLDLGVVVMVFLFFSSIRAVSNSFKHFLVPVDASAGFHREGKQSLGF